MHMNQRFKPDDTPCLVFSVWQIEELEDQAYQRGVNDTLLKFGHKIEEERDDGNG